MYDVKLIKQPSGRTHQVGGVYQPIIDEASGEPEQEYVLVALVDEHAIPLQSFTVGYVEHQLGRPDTAIDKGSSSSSAEPASTGQPAAVADEGAAPAEGQGNAANAAAAPQPPADQQTG